MKPTVYIETTIPSYLTAASSCNLIAHARQEITRAWWQFRRNRFALVISQLVLEEAGRGNPEAAARRLKALEPYPLLDASPSAFKLADEFIRPGAMPAKAKDDSLHLAICAVHGVQFLLTWNFRHIANAETRNVLREICTRKGYPFPTICTPDEMMKGTI
ncbi:MAG: type II toxin-antitoxin system VapC family toxin [Verrucomicrobiae bacterium]